jgi:hypothetical protein
MIFNILQGLKITFLRHDSLRYLKAIMHHLMFTLKS